MPGLGATFGRGAATMPQWDLANSDCVLIMGSNMAENHPVAFRFVMQAKARGATVIHVDPRFTRTSALADIYAPIRSGTDIAFLGGIIHYILENNLWFKEYALNYTNLATAISNKIKDTSELDGFFSGWDEDLRAYKLDTWQYRGENTPEVLEEYDVRTGSPFSEQIKRISKGPAPQDLTLQDSFCVYQILRRHFAAYTPEMVSKVTGCPRDTFLQIAKAIASNSGREKTGAVCYAVAWTHHTTGVQIIRAAGILQALLGNIGRPGAGILALRGHCSIQGSTDIPTLYNMLPGYLAQPHAHKDHATFEAYLESETHQKGFWNNFPKFAFSLMRAWYGDNAGEHNQWGFQWIPKIMGDHSQLPLTMAMADGTIRGLLLIGQNPVIGGHNAGLILKGLANLEWLVVRETFENETAAFWKNSAKDPRKIKTEVFMLPAAMAGEKDGTFTNTHRLVQWHDKVVDPPAHCRSDLWFIYHLGKRLKALYADSTDPKDAPIQNLMWDYPEIGPNQDPSAEAVLKEINGYTWPAREQLQSAQQLQADGSTACGAWIYTGVFPNQDHNQARSRVPDGPDGPGSHLGWAFAWPANRRTLYNRASADPEGRPWSQHKCCIWWNAQTGQWEGNDVPDFPADKAPDYSPDWTQDPKGMAAVDGRSPFIMISDGKSSLFVPSGIKDGPLPAHFEPVESPLRNPFYHQQDNPAAKKWPRLDNPYHNSPDPDYPHAITTYRLTEHHSGAIPTRMVPILAELQPEGFAEIPPQLAAEKHIVNLDWIVISTARGAVETRALISSRLQPLDLNGRLIYQIGMPWHFGWQGFATGQIANMLTAVVGDPNTTIHEGKAFTCNLHKGRLPRRNPS